MKLVHRAGTQHLADMAEEGELSPKARKGFGKLQWSIKKADSLAKEYSDLDDGLSSSPRPPSSLPASTAQKSPTSYSPI